MSANRHKNRFLITIETNFLIKRRFLTIEKCLKHLIILIIVLQSLRNRCIITIETI